MYDSAKSYSLALSSIGWAHVFLYGIFAHAQAPPATPPEHEVPVSIFATDDMVFWDRSINHEVVQILEHPFTFLVIDAPVRREGNVLRYKQ